MSSAYSDKFFQYNFVQNLHQLKVSKSILDAFWAKLMASWMNNFNCYVL